MPERSRYGVAVLDCLAGWQNFSDTDAFKNNTYEQMRDQIRVNRNHCSVVAWEPSLNESGFTAAWAQNMHNLVKEELYSTFIEKAKEEFKKKFNRSPKIYDVVISDGARRLE